MTDEQHAHWLAYLRSLGDQMRLRDWRIILSRDELDNPQHIACAQRTYGRRVLVVSLSAHFLAQDAETQRHTCVHELLHAHTNAVYDVIANASSALGTVTYGMLEGAMDDAVEYLTDGIADVLAPFLPLPPAVGDL